MLKLGLMCGTFDPPHIGHLILAQMALGELGLDRILFLPVGDPTHKTTGTSASHRIKMTELAISDNPDFVLDDMDAVRPGPHYTATLLPLIQDKFPTAKLWLLIGGDSLAAFSEWHRPAEILNYCRIAVLDRPKVDTKFTLSDRLRAALSGKIDKLTGPSIDLSSTWLRNYFSQVEDLSAEIIPARYLIHPAVGRYIIENDLYQ